MEKTEKYARKNASRWNNVNKSFNQFKGALTDNEGDRLKKHLKILTKKNPDYWIASLAIDYKNAEIQTSKLLRKAFYNYVYYTVAGFTEHDTFRSNQIREGDLTREEALELVLEENRPRYPNIKWYLDAVGVDFKEAIKVVNSIPKLY